MLYRYRYIILSALLTIVVVAVCLFAPDFFLMLERRGDTGRVMHGENVYNADDISDDSISTFNFQKRLMMLSGQWKCEKEAVEAVADVLDAASLERICVSIPALLMQDYTDILEQEDFWYSFMGGEIDEAVNNYWRMLDVAEAKGVQEQSSKANIPDSVYLAYAALFYGGQTELYKYTDSILSGYSFYVWEYSVDNKKLGVTYEIKVDAVTLDIYSFSIDGTKMGSMGWNDLLKSATIYIDVYGSLKQSYFDALNNLPFIDQGAISTNILPLAHCRQMYSDYMSNNISGIRAFKSGSQGYSYTMNFLQRSDIEAQMVEEGVLMMTSGNETVYACINTSAPGFEFYFTNDPLVVVH